MLKHASLLLAAALTPAVASAETMGFREPGGIIAVELIDGWQIDADTRIAALAILLEPGWKTYWRAPGALGIPPRLNWSGSRNVASIEPIWPVPQVFAGPGEPYLAFAERLILPLKIDLTEVSAPAQLRLVVDFGVCSDICVPASQKVSIDLHLTALPGERYGWIEAALANLPRSAEEAGVQDISCNLLPSGDIVELQARIGLPEGGLVPEIVVIETPVRDLWVAPAAITMDGRTITASTRMEYFGNAPLVLDRSDLRLTLIGDGEAVEITGCPATAS